MKIQNHSKANTRLPLILLSTVVCALSTATAGLTLVDFGTVAPAGNSGEFTLESGRTIPYTVSDQFSGTFGVGTEIAAFPGDVGGARNFDSNGEELWFVTGGTGSTGYTITFDVRNQGTVPLVFATGHLFELNQAEYFAVPTGGTLTTGTGGLVNFTNSDHDDLADWYSYRGSTSSEDAAVGSGFVATPGVTYSATAGLEKYMIQSLSADDKNSTYHFLETGDLSKIDYVVARFDLNPSGTSNTERWNLAVAEAVPEPSSTVLSSIGIMFLLFRRRR